MNSIEKESSWDFYPCTVNGAPALITLDLAVSEDAPIPELRSRVSVVLKMEDSSPRGLGSSETSERFRTIESYLVEQCSSCENRCVGRVRASGEWEIVFYAKQAKSLEECLERAIGEWSPQLYAIVSRLDPNWEYYLDHLFPSEETLIWMDNRKAVNALRDKGDDPSIARTVEHHLSFEAREQALRASKAIASEGFSIEIIGDERQDEGVDLFATRIDSVALDTINRIALELNSKIAPFGGVYCGWELERGTRDADRQDL